MTEIAVPTVGRMVGCGLPVRMVWRYSPTDPWAARMVFPDDVDRAGRVNEWFVARDVFADGLYHRSGVGDVQVWPAAPGVVAVSIASDEGAVRLWLPRRDLVVFLRAVYRLVPRGRERDHVDVDAAVGRLLAGA